MKKLWKIIVLIILVLVTILSINIVNKINILNNFTNAMSNLSNAENYHLKVIEENGNITEVFYRNGDFIYKTLANNTERMFYITKDEKLLIVNSENAKTVNTIDKAPMMSLLNTNYYTTNGIFGKIQLALKTKIKSEILNDNEVYLLTDKNVSTWIDKDTYIVQKEDNGGIKNYEVELNSVTENDLVKPDLSEYTIY